MWSVGTALILKIHRFLKFQDSQLRMLFCNADEEMIKSRFSLFPKMIMKISVFVVLTFFQHYKKKIVDFFLISTIRIHQGG